MKRGLKKTLLMIKGTKKRNTKKRAIKHTPPNGMVKTQLFLQVISLRMQYKWVLQVQTTKKKMSRDVTKNKNTNKL